MDPDSAHRLNQWFLSLRRDFPWRIDPTPYRVWVSEVMLQQTRAQVVIPYFERWMEAFPDLASLARAPIEQVMKLWEGLGYYSRARHLHRGAQQIVEQHQGEIPADRNTLLQIGGIGPYTANAILSFGFHQRAPAVDGNVLRVISRYQWIEGFIEELPIKRSIEAFAETFLDAKEPWVTAEALIELGATLCSPQRPRCEECPLCISCQGALRGTPEELPKKRAQPVIEKLIRGVAVVEWNGSVLLQQNPPGQIMEGLFEFPYFPNQKYRTGVQRAIEELLGQKVVHVKPLYMVKHSFTRFSATLFPFHFKATEGSSTKPFRWVPRAELKQLPFSAGHRKIYRSLEWK